MMIKKKKAGLIGKNGKSKKKFFFIEIISFN